MIKLPHTILQVLTNLYGSHQSHEMKEYRVQQLIVQEDEELRPLIEDAWKQINQPKHTTTIGWKHSNLQYDKKNNLMTNPNNLFTILSEHPSFKDRLTFNELTRNVCYDGQEIQDLNYTKLRTDLCTQLKLTFSKGDVIDMAELVANNHPFHPIRDYLSSLKWTGQDMIVSLLQAMQIEPNDLNKECLQKWLIACVARIMKPGCKVDSIPVIQGLTGNKKSTALKALMPKEEWFTDEKIDFDTKDALQILLGKWIVELAELSSFNRRDNNQIKSNITRTIDEFRSPYDRKPKKYARQFCYIGTTNDLEFLTDPTSNRRYWVFINKGEIDTATIISLRDQIWAQAYCLFSRGDAWWLSRETENQMAQVAEAFESKDAWHDEISEYLNGKIFVTTTEVLGFIKHSSANCDNTDRNRVVKIMQFLRWENCNQRINGNQTCGWKRPEHIIGRPLPQSTEQQMWSN